MLRIGYEELEATFRRVLIDRGANENKASDCARIFAQNSLDGVYSHGANRFPLFVEYIDKGYIKLNAQPECVASLGAIEQWNGNEGIGNTNAEIAMNRAMELADKYGIGCVALGNSNHWMRGGTYGLQAARAGYVGICWTNTRPNMPAWGAKDCRIGNNPLVFAVPYGDKPVLVDAAMSQFAYGALERYRLADKELPLPGGYDERGELTCVPGDIEKTRRLMPMGYWKGCAFSVALDLIASVLSGGLCTCQVGELDDDEHKLCQVFIAIDPKLNPSADDIISKTLEYVRNSERAGEESVRCPGDGMHSKREENLRLGIPVDERVWNTINSL